MRNVEVWSTKVNLYGYILETEYGMTVSGYYLAVVHPELTQARLISCPKLFDEMTAMHQYEIECGRANVSTSDIDASFL